ncbi:MAG: hypothetical protein LBR26_13230 [Prevotella sp.]|jgi:hypothetical protein|nr:hypothetical protein [Prevotella sp.]
MNDKSILELPELPEDDFEKSWVPGSVQEDAEEDNWTGRYRLPAIVRKSTDYTDDRLNQTALSNVSIDEDPATKKLCLSKVDKNLGSGITVTTNTLVREASETENGLMPAASFQQIATNTADISSLKGIGRIAVHLGATPSQIDLTIAWTTIKGIAPGDGATVVNLDQDAPAGHAWTYLETGEDVSEWIDRGTDTVNQAATDLLGVVKGLAAITVNAGKVFVESDGSMSVIGWDSLLQSMNSILPYLTFKLAAQSLSSVSNIPATAANTFAQISGSANLSISNIANLKPGYEMVIRVKNTASSAITLTLPVASLIDNDYGPATLEIPASGVAEVSIWCYTATMYSVKASLKQ